jgi:hypothetical protein
MLNKRQRALAMLAVIALALVGVGLGIGSRLRKTPAPVLVPVPVPVPVSTYPAPSPAFPSPSPTSAPVPIPSAAKPDACLEFTDPRLKMMQRCVRCGPGFHVDGYNGCKPDGPLLAPAVLPPPKITSSAQAAAFAVRWMTARGTTARYEALSVTPGPTAKCAVVAKCLPDYWIVKIGKPPTKIANTTVRVFRVGRAEIVSQHRVS